MKIRNININHFTYKTINNDKTIKSYQLGICDTSFKKLLYTGDIKLLSDNSAKEVWLYIYGEFYNKKTRWFLNKNHWMNSVIREKKIESVVVWMQNNTEIPSEVVKQKIKENLSYSDDDRIFFFETAYEMFECSWKTFTDYLDAFIYYNDESQIWCYQHSEILQIRPYGDIIKIEIPTEN